MPAALPSCQECVAGVGQQGLPTSSDATVGYLQQTAALPVSTAARSLVSRLNLLGRRLSARFAEAYSFPRSLQAVNQGAGARWQHRLALPGSGLSLGAPWPCLDAVLVKPVWMSLPPSSQAAAWCLVRTAAAAAAATHCWCRLALAAPPGCRRPLLCAQPDSRQPQ